jgi:hypothetical protein
MILTAHVVLLILALVFAILDAAQIPARIRWMGLAFACFILSILVGGR